MPDKAPHSLEGAKQYIRDRFDAGADCPCCGQFVKRYKRKLNSNMIRFLVSLGKVSAATGETWIEYSRCSFRGRDYNQIAHWGLAETAPLSSSSEKRSSGLWRITDLGRGFLSGAVEVPSHVFLYNGEALKFSEELVTIHGAYDEHFDFSELMRERTPGQIEDRPWALAAREFVETETGAAASSVDLASRIGKGKVKP